ncbi:MAG: hypothetical protein ABI451_11695 [Dokdonella sp.]
MAWRKLAAFIFVSVIVPEASATPELKWTQPEGTTVTVTVGSDAACNYANITQAVILAAASTNLNIRVAKNNVMTGTQTIIGRDNVAIYGGYDTCSSTTPNGHTVLSGSAFTGSVLRTNASFSGTGTYNVLLSAITIANGTGSSTLPGGGMTIDGPFSVYLTDTFVLSNTTAFSGGGISVRGELGTGAVSTERTKLVLFGNTNVIDNHAAMGGGIACTFRAYVQMSDSLISSNTATSAGGGVASQQCFFQSYGHVLPTQGIRTNTVTGAGGAGGGIYAAGGTVYLQPFPAASSIVANNSAETGGGIDVVAGNLYVTDSSVINNTAQLRGGGIYTVNATTIVARTSGASSCHVPLRCSELSGNQVTGTGATASGGGLFASGGTTLIAGTFIENDRVAAGRGMAIATLNATGTNGGIDINGLRIFGSVIATSGTGGPAVAADSSIVLIDTGSAVLGFDTFSRNLAVPRIVYTPTAGGETYPVDIYGTIFDATSGLAADPGANGPVPNGDCNRLHETSSPFAGTSTRSTTLPPMFVNAAGNDYTLAFNSPMIDWCNASYNYPIGLTAEGGVRPYDDPFFTALYGNWDLGALELQPLDIIFKNGFN